jgi:hypothetical protein
MLVVLCISSGNLIILCTIRPVALSQGLRQSGLQVCWNYKEPTDAQFGITPKNVCLSTCQTWILPSSRRFGFLHLTIHVRYVRGQTMLIRCCFAIIVMVYIIFFASSWSSLKFPPAVGTVHHVLLQHLDYIQTMPCFSWLRSRGGYMKISSQIPVVHCI